MAAPAACSIPFPMASDPIHDESITEAPAVRAPRRTLGPREEQLSTPDRLWIFWEENRKIVLAVAGGLLALVVLGVALTMWRNSRNEKASELLAQTVPLFEQGQYAQALRDSTGRVGLTTIADEYGGTKAGNLARFYAAQALYETKRYDDALRYFRDFDGEGTFLGPNALAAEAAILENKGQHAEAARAYVKAADASDSDLFAPGYLLNAARAYLAAGDAAAAKAALDRIKEDYELAPENQQLDFYYGQVDARLASTAR
jgi:tetratricopeptide (TPR) repeat protein